LLSVLLRLVTVVRVARVASLQAIDYVGVVAALFTALAVNLILTGNGEFSLAWHHTKQWSALVPASSFF
jgi:hypothetical protein